MIPTYNTSRSSSTEKDILSTSNWQQIEYRPSFMTVKTEDISHSVQPNIYTDMKNG